MRRKVRSRKRPRAISHETSAIESAPEGLKTPKLNALQADFELAQRCVAGEVAAWEQLHSQCHDKLTRTVRGLLGGRNSDLNLADEITARVWYALVANDGDLLARYDPGRGGRLITFMRAIARDMMCRYFRAERRRTARECEASRGKAPYYSEQRDQIDRSLDEFLGTLTPGERQFCGDYLLNPPEAGEKFPAGDLSRANLWQKTHRVYIRFLHFFGDDT